jgi:hypothetical protein
VSRNIVRQFDMLLDPQPSAPSTEASETPTYDRRTIRVAPWMLLISSGPRAGMQD